MLCAIWTDVLGVEAVGVHDSFFELGGHTLALTRVAARVRNRFGVDLVLRVYFEAVTVEALPREIVWHALRQRPADDAGRYLDEALAGPAATAATPPTMTTADT